ncbi:CCA tRNA nucleotidyltransferase [Lacticaseibacillus brantae]|uniref:CCA-adding enzyme n=1 Tax=Lacticaseibacillus brantae DSM 23927 TaxID=1423727 RepID=A0A0R2B1H6_9LACO|nr:CCA tRNA nucleotidyltransferase [Lacticaseibacillus brantae]KRM72610.1 tRNA nucleotidyltransferase poly(A) polymerase [Lacticaseibacillus brantae DSM 23927]
MQLDLSHPDFQAAIPIMQQIEAAGFEAYFVGGSVRDALLGLPIHDVDIATSAYPEEVKQIFKKTVDTGIQHGTVMVLAHGVGYEVTTFRTESTYQDFRRPDSVTFVRSLAEDLKRRDFTVNALAARHDGTIIDLFDGLSDLAAKRLKAVGDPQARFNEDALRMMRAVRFQSQLGFEIEPATLAAIKAHAPLLAHISVERTASELTKLMLGIARNPAWGNFLETGLSHYCPDFADEDLTPLLELNPARLPSAEAAWTLIAQQVTVPATKLLKDWKQANALIDIVTRTLRVLATSTPSPWMLYQAGQEAIETLIAVRTAQNPAFDANSLRQAYAQLPIHDKHELAIDGGQLITAGFKPGRQLGQILNRLERAVVAGDLVNDSTVLLQNARTDEALS